MQDRKPNLPYSLKGIDGRYTVDAVARTVATCVERLKAQTGNDATVAYIHSNRKEMADDIEKAISEELGRPITVIVGGFGAPRLPYDTWVGAGAPHIPPEPEPVRKTHPQKKLEKSMLPQAVEVESDFIQEIVFMKNGDDDDDPDLGMLEVTMDTVEGAKSYLFWGVPQSLFQEFNLAESKGTFYNKHIRGRYEFPE